MAPWPWANRYTTLPLAECPFYALPALVPSLKEESFWDREPSTKAQIGTKTGTDNGRFIHWLQDVPDQAAILRQYCRYSGEVKSGRNIKQLVNRALEFTMSDPKGPAYLMAAREVLEEVSSDHHLRDFTDKMFALESGKKVARRRAPEPNGTKCIARAG